jgi:hypothetical protein
MLLTSTRNVARSELFPTWAAKASETFIASRQGAAVSFGSLAIVSPMPENLFVFVRDPDLGLQGMTSSSKNRQGALVAETELLYRQCFQLDHGYLREVLLRPLLNVSAYILLSGDTLHSTSKTAPGATRTMVPMPVSGISNPWGPLLYQ